MSTQTGRREKYVGGVDLPPLDAKDTKPYSPVNVLGEIEENLELFNRLRSGSRIIIEKI